MLQAYCSMIKLILCFDKAMPAGTVRPALSSTSQGVVNFISSDGVS